MENYYQILEISPSASEEEIKKALFATYRKWSNRTNAPQLERRQEAERIVKLLQTVEEILLDPEKRAIYDRQLLDEPSSTPEARMEPTTPVEPGETDGVEKGWLLLHEGKTLEALSLAKKFIESNEETAEAWDLLVEIHHKRGEQEKAIEACKQTIRLNSDSASNYARLGRLLEAAEQLEDARIQYKQAWKLDPNSLEYCGAVGILSVKTEQYTEALAPLEKCIEDEPDQKKNSMYQWYLAFAYHRMAYTNWTRISKGHSHVDEGLYATDKKHIREARSYLDRALGLSFNDPKLFNLLVSCKQDLQRLSSRKFVGNWLLPSITAGIGIFAILFDVIMNIRLSTTGGVIMLLLSFLYILSAFSPLYAINRRLIAGGTQWDWITEQWKKRKVVVGVAGSLGIILLFPFIQVILSLFVIALILHNFQRNDWIKWQNVYQSLRQNESSKESLNR